VSRVSSWRLNNPKFCALECRDIDILKLFFWSDHLTRKAAPSNLSTPHLSVRHGTVPGTEEVRQQGRYPIQTKCMVELLLLQ
jgi:hypothetical protein